jgi:energy-coupling factor transport system permease protein
VITYRRGSTPLHTARAGVVLAWGAVLAAAAFAAGHPLALAVVAVVAAGAAWRAGVARQVGRAALFALPMALLIAAANPLFVREGLTVVYRLGSVPPFGRVDITLEALVAGGVLGVRALLIIVVFALLAAVVDPDEVLRGLRRVSFRGGLTAALAMRIAPVLARDGRRMALARRSRAAAPASPTAAERIAVVRAVTTGALDRAIDLAATLELRGYATAAPARRSPRPWSRHDRGFAASAAGMVLLLALAVAVGEPRLRAYPELELAAGPAAAVLAAAFATVALAPLVAARRGGRR